MRRGITDHIYTNCFLIAFFVLTNISATAQTWQDTSALIDGILNRFPNSSPIGQLAISRNGELLYSGVKGMANLEYGVPLSKESKIEAGSVSKQITGACILLLEQQGKLSLSDDIRKYLPEVPDYGSTITISHLLHHTSGIRDFLPITYLTGWPTRTKTYSNNDYLQIIVDQKSLNSKPGEEYIYCNSNYVLLTIILERVSNTTLAEFSYRHIFEPAGMKNSEWRDDFKKVVPNRAIAYFKSDNIFIIEMPNESSYGHAGLLTTAEDLVRWNNYYLSGKLGSPSLLHNQLTTGTLNNGRRTSYAAGLNVIKGNNLQRVSHAGLTAGYRANLEYFAQSDLSIAWISNSSQPEVFEISTAIRNIFIKPPQTKTDSTISINAFRKYLGMYREEKTGTFLNLIMDGKGIYNQTTGPGQRLRTVNESTLLMGSQLLNFPPGNLKKALLISNSGDTTSFIGIESASLDSNRADEYTGTFSSKEVEGKLVIVNRYGRMFIKLKQDLEFPLLPLYKDGFTFRFQNQSTGMTFIVNFQRDKKQKISGFEVSEPRARRIRYEKKTN